MLLIVWQLVVLPGEQTVTLTVGLLGYDGSFTVMARTFGTESELPETPLPPAPPELAGGVLDPLPPQPASNVINRRIGNILFDFISTHS
jgi:hypothetical protein